jgi:hypothetical protein
VIVSVELIVPCSFVMERSAAGLRWKITENAIW